MEKKFGTSRVAYVGEKWTYKRPLTHLRAIQNGDLALLKNIRKGKWKRVGWFFTKGMDSSGSLGRCLGQRGYLENQRETTSWQELGDIVFPVHRIVGNFLVRQQTTGDISLTTNEMWEIVRSTSLNIDAVLASAGVNHTLEKSNNYGVEPETGKVRIRDFGGERVADFIQTHRASIEELLEKLSERAKVSS